MKFGGWFLVAGVLFAQGPDPKKLGALADYSQAIEELAKRVSPAVVEIQVTGFGTTENTEGNVGLVTRHRATGSGVVVDAEGYIMTNAHVLSGARRVRVMVTEVDPAKKRIARPVPVDAKIVGLDVESDLGLIKIDHKMTAIQFGDAEQLRQGQIVMAIGTPLGLQNSVSMGVVSSTHRHIKTDDTMSYIQTDAPINPGNSGGALVDAQGKLVGINTFILSQSGGSEGLGFAIPSTIVRSVYQQLRKNGHVHRGEIGVSVQSVTPLLAAGFKLKQDWGVIVSDVARGSPAEEAGVQYKDVVLSLNGRPMESSSEFEIELYRTASGQKVKLDILRGEQPLTIEVAVSERTDSSDRLAQRVDPEKNLVARLGFLCIEVDREIAEMMPGLRDNYGIVVAGRAALVPGVEVPLETGDVVHAVNGESVVTLDRFRKMIDALEPGDAVVLEVERPSRRLFLTFEWE